LQLEVKAARPGEASLVYDIIQTAFAEYIGAIPVPPGAMNETLPEVEQAISEGCVLLAWHDTEAVGTARYQLHPEYLYVGRVAVLPTHRRRGIGKALMAYIEQMAPALGRTRIRLGTRQSMPTNLAFYEQLGYKVVGTEPHSKGPDTNVWLEKELTP
jgi:ribosomal protein S18 acetylase RimI-like enzyme